VRTALQARDDVARDRVGRRRERGGGEPSGHPRANEPRSHYEHAHAIVDERVAEPLRERVERRLRRAVDDVCLSRSLAGDRGEDDERPAAVVEQASARTRTSANKVSGSGKIETVDADSLRKGDVIIVRTSEIIPADGEIILAVGPEGGWTEDELKSFHQAAWTSASLGNTILRAETAAIAATAVIASALHKQ